MRKVRNEYAQLSNYSIHGTLIQEAIMGNIDVPWWPLVDAHGTVGLSCGMPPHQGHNMSVDPASHGFGPIDIRSTQAELITREHLNNDALLEKFANREPNQQYMPVGTDVSDHYSQDGVPRHESYAQRLRRIMLGERNPSQSEAWRAWRPNSKAWDKVSEDRPRSDSSLTGIYAFSDEGEIVESKYPDLTALARSYKERERPPQTANTGTDSPHRDVNAYNQEVIAQIMKGLHLPREDVVRLLVDGDISVVGNPDGSFRVIRRREPERKNPSKREDNYKSPSSSSALYDASNTAIARAKDNSIVVTPEVPCSCRDASTQTDIQSDRGTACQHAGASIPHRSSQSWSPSEPSPLELLKGVHNQELNDLRASKSKENGIRQTAAELQKSLAHRGFVLASSLTPAPRTAMGRPHPLMAGTQYGPGVRGQARGAGQARPKPRRINEDIYGVPIRHGVNVDDLKEGESRDGYVMTNRGILNIQDALTFDT